MSEYDASSPSAAAPSPAGPPQIPPVPKQRTSGRWGWLLFTILLLGGFGIIALFGVMVVAGALGQSTAGRVHYQEDVLVDGSTGGKVVVVDVKGVIMSGADGRPGMADEVIEVLRVAKRDPDVVAVVLDMDTPGGGVTPSDEIHHEVQKVRASGKKVITCMRGVAASGGYYIAAGTDYIIANRHTLTGSIGVIIGGFNMSGLMEKVGVEPRIYKSGEFKDLLSMTRKEDSEFDAREAELVQGMIEEAFGEFVKIVAGGRKLDEAVVRAAPIGDARILSGAEALELKLVDELGYLEDAIEHARAGSDHSVVRIGRRPNPLELLLSAQSGAKAIELNMVPEEWKAVKKGRLYFMSPLFY